MEIKVWVDGIQRIVCGATEKTTCQDVVYALAHATRQTGRFTLIERWRNNERLLAPQENPLKVLHKWGSYASEVQFILQRSELEAKHPPPPNPNANRSNSNIHQQQQQPVFWKAPPFANGPNEPSSANARLSPDSGRGSDQTVNSEMSNGVHHHEGLPYLPSYRPPPSHGPGTGTASPPPYRFPPAPSSHKRATPYSHGSVHTSTVRPPRYSPPPTHRSSHPNRRSTALSSDSKDHDKIIYSRRKAPKGAQDHMEAAKMNHLIELVGAQQSVIYSQEAEMKQFDSEAILLSKGSYYSPGSQSGFSLANNGDPVDAVHSETQRLEKVSLQNERELDLLEASSVHSNSFINDSTIKNEIMQLKHRLAGTDYELQRTNHTLRRLGDEMKAMSLEKTRQHEEELKHEIESIHDEIRMLKQNSEEGASINRQLQQEVSAMEEQIFERKAEINKLLNEMKHANMESLSISNEDNTDSSDQPVQNGNGNAPPTSQHQPMPGAVPTKNPYGVWV